MIARVMHGGAADRSGLIHAGDEVIEVNGISVENKTPADVLSILVFDKKNCLVHQTEFKKYIGYVHRAKKKCSDTVI